VRNAPEGGLRWVMSFITHYPASPLCHGYQLSFPSRPSCLRFARRMGCTDGSSLFFGGGFMMKSPAGLFFFVNSYLGVGDDPFSRRHRPSLSRILEYGVLPSPLARFPPLRRREVFFAPNFLRGLGRAYFPFARPLPLFFPLLRSPFLSLPPFAIPFPLQTWRPAPFPPVQDRDCIIRMRI